MTIAVLFFIKGNKLLCESVFVAKSTDAVLFLALPFILCNAAIVLNPCWNPD